MSYTGRLLALKLCRSSGFYTRLFKDYINHQGEGIQMFGSHEQNQRADEKLFSHKIYT